MGLPFQHLLEELHRLPHSISLLVPLSKLRHCLQVSELRRLLQIDLAEGLDWDLLQELVEHEARFHIAPLRHLLADGAHLLLRKNKHLFEAWKLKKNFQNTEKEGLSV